MAQLSEDLVREFLRYNAQCKPAPYTFHEFRQLCNFWLHAHGLEPEPAPPARGAPTLSVVSGADPATGEPK